MFARPTSKLSRRDRVGGPQGSGHWFLRVILVLATLSLFALVTVDGSQACASNTGVTAIFKQRSHDLKQIAKQPLIVDRAAVTSINNVLHRPYCCENRLGFCPGSFCGGACCISAVLAAEWSVSWDAILRTEFPSLRSPATSSGVDTQFRPPRIAL